MIGSDPDFKAFLVNPGSARQSIVSKGIGLQGFAYTSSTDTLVRTKTSRCRFTTAEDSVDYLCRQCPLLGLSSVSASLDVDYAQHLISSSVQGYEKS